jgi:D-glycero-D-manno-heptose 1,7-bisphosphate phosphatase
MTSTRPAVFLDRDGVLNAVVMRDGKPASPRSLEELQIAPEAPASLQALKDAGFLLLAATNQPDISRGLMAEAAARAINRALERALPLDEISICPHDNADACNCRKPKPGMLLGMAARHAVDLARSWMVGDQERDIACGQAAGCRTVLLARDYNRPGESRATFVAESLSQAVARILSSPPCGAPGN